MDKSNALYIQSGGPTAVINASAYGVIKACEENADYIDKIFAARYGMEGVLLGDLIEVNKQDQTQIELLPKTPGMAFGSCRYKVTHYDEDETEYREILNVLRANNIRYIFLNGGNGTVNAGNTLSEYLTMKDYNCKIMMIPKTVDNDIYGIDHSPGFPSAAVHVVVTISELLKDAATYNREHITLVEVMGRDTGWLTAAASLAGCEGEKPDLFYFPEITFNIKDFLNDIESVLQKKNKCFIIVSEGVKDEHDKYLFEYSKEFGENSNENMGDVTPYLEKKVKERFDCKIRAINLNMMQRCAAHSASEIDVREAIELGKAAVYRAVCGDNGKIVYFKRESMKGYNPVISTLDMKEAINKGKTLPAEYIEDGTISKKFAEYLEPFICDLPKYYTIK